MIKTGRWLLPRVFGAAAAIGALGLAASAGTASACPEHDKPSDAGGSASSGSGSGSDSAERGAGPSGNAAGSAASTQTKNTPAGGSAGVTKVASSNTRDTEDSGSEMFCPGGTTDVGPCSPSGQ